MGVAAALDCCLLDAEGSGIGVFASNSSSICCDSCVGNSTFVVTLGLLFAAFASSAAEFSIFALFSPADEMGRAAWSDFGGGDSPEVDLGGDGYGTYDDGVKYSFQLWIENCAVLPSLAILLAA